MLNDILKDAERQSQEVPKDEVLKQVGQLCSDLIATENKIEQLEKLLKEEKDKEDYISSVQIPELLRQFGLAEIKLTDGSKISVSKKYLASITEANREAAYDWLRDNDCGHIINDKLEIKFVKRKKDEDNSEYEDILKLLEEHEIPFAEKGEIPWQTLRAFAKEQMEDSEKAETFPKELFSVYVKDVTKVKKG